MISQTSESSHRHLKLLLGFSSVSLDFMHRKLFKEYSFRAAAENQQRVIWSIWQQPHVVSTLNHTGALAGVPVWRVEAQTGGEKRNWTAALMEQKTLNVPKPGVEGTNYLKAWSLDLFQTCDGLRSEVGCWKWETPLSFFCATEFKLQMLETCKLSVKVSTSWTSWDVWC